MTDITRQSQFSDEYVSGMPPDMVQAKQAAWDNFRRLILGGGVAAIVALGALWWVTY
jgi:hypothetical protein